MCLEFVLVYCCLFGYVDEFLVLIQLVFSFVQMGKKVILQGHSEVQPNSTYWFRASYPFRPLIQSALIGSDVAKHPLTYSI
ncbi:hypothetical protein Hanom_Chr14g01331331 [Helianthus anomalus]